MWTAAMFTNIAGYHWHTPSRWMYYHLLDGDLSSNSLSWQWICGAFSSKQYMMNQELINGCSIPKDRQSNTFLDINRDSVTDMNNLPIFSDTLPLDLPVCLPKIQSIRLDKKKGLVLYHPWCLDPSFLSDIDLNRVLVIEPSHFDTFPVSQKVMDFICELAHGVIPDIQIYVGEVDDLVVDFENDMYFRYNKNVEHFPGTCELNPELFPGVKGYYKNFFTFWKECQRYL
jgi:deoxyribodipyrimidine photo-lyase